VHARCRARWSRSPSPLTARRQGGLSWAVLPSLGSSAHRVPVPRLCPPWCQAWQVQGLRSAELPNRQSSAATQHRAMAKSESSGEAKRRIPMRGLRCDREPRGRPHHSAERRRSGLRPLEPTHRLQGRQPERRGCFLDRQHAHVPLPIREKNFTFPGETRELMPSPATAARAWREANPEKVAA
jgi:hypothetical protein